MATGMPAPPDRGALHYVYAWGESPVPSTIAATSMTALHLRPFRLLPMLFPPALLFSSYINVQGYTRDAAGVSAAWSAAYLVLSRRGSRSAGAEMVGRSRWGTRGLVRGATLLTCVANVVGGGLVWAFSESKGEDEK